MTTVFEVEHLFFSRLLAGVNCVEGAEQTMDGDHRRALTKCQVTLLELLNPEDYVLDYLLSEEIISTAEKDKVSQKSTPKEQARELLTVIPRKGAKAWNAFLEGLLGSQADAHREAADALKKMLTRVTGVMEERSPRLPTSTTRTAGRESDESMMVGKTPASHYYY